MIHIDPLISSQKVTAKQKVSALNISAGSVYPVQLNHHPSPDLLACFFSSSPLLSTRNTCPGNFLCSVLKYFFLGTCTKTGAIEGRVTINPGILVLTETTNFVAKMLSRWLNWTEGWHSCSKTISEKLGCVHNSDKRSQAETTVTQRKHKWLIWESLAQINDNTVIIQQSWSTTARLNSSRCCSKNRRKVALICTQDKLVISSYN